MSPRSRETWRFSQALGAIALVTLGYATVFPSANAVTVSTTFLLVVLLVAAVSTLRVALVTSIAAVLALNFFFLPPVGTLTVADPQNWFALLAFLVVSVVASHLSAVAQARTQEAVERRDELARLFDLGRDVFVVTDDREALSALARSVARRFDLEFVAVALPRDGDWVVYQWGAYVMDLDRRQLTNAYASAQASLEFDAYARTYAGHRTFSAEGRDIRLVPLRAGTRPIGVLAAAGRPIEPGTLDALAGVVATAVERAHLVEELKAGELARQGEQLKTALLASLSHDLRTPLTAIRVAAANLRVPELTHEGRVEQSDIVLAETARLTRLFENILDMARIDAGAVASDMRWTHPSEIVAAARDQVEHALRAHRVEVTIERDVPVRLDPRLTATALAHLLENAGQYAPPASTIHVDARLAGDELVVQVRDHGPGIAAADLSRLFERFYRGSAARTRTSGTGLGLWIVRGLLAAGRGRVWAENCVDGGARFTIAVPVVVKAPEPAATPSL
ncbi:MAG: ATP-binding protein [Vicinamibacterales bacterium]